MGRALAESFPAARRVFEDADEAIGFPLSRLCFEGPEDQLKLTENQQPALLTVSIAAFTVLREKGWDPDYVAGQTLLASLIMSPNFQTVFNKAKGSIPARLDVDLADFNPCQQMAKKDLQASISGGSLVRSMAHNMTVLQKYRGAILEVVTQYTNNPKTTAKQAAEQMADTVEAQK